MPPILNLTTQLRQISSSAITAANVLAALSKSAHIPDPDLLTERFVYILQLVRRGECREYSYSFDFAGLYDRVFLNITLVSGLEVKFEFLYPSGAGQFGRGLLLSALEFATQNPKIRKK